MKRARYIGASRERDGRKLTRGEYGWVETTKDRGTEFVQQGSYERWFVYSDEIVIMIEAIRLDVPSTLMLCAGVVLLMGLVGYTLWRLG